MESISNPVTSTKTHMLGSFWDIGSSSPTNAGNQKFTWSLPCRIHEREIYDTLREQALWDPAEREEHELEADLKDSIEEFDAGMGTPSGRSTKLSVREQARQFEQQALSDKTSRDSQDSLDLDDLLAIIEPQSSSGIAGKETPPCILITGTTPPPPATQQSTPPVLRRFSSSISSYVIVEPCEIWLEIIPDSPDSPPCPSTVSLSPGACSPPVNFES
ncbi:protocadherin-15-like [Tachysurus fulvidraco]|uniref:protocadherin-15-like n=1 Tax=Tachysurus fulvidraco TaxID=1234273 RepID=UPI001FEE33F7|nr:protocadherin-15-like [Tachysurus fulvidraco]